ncbi:MAG: MBL fold metallo-hydrolase [Balneolaceae bacterium]
MKLFINQNLTISLFFLLSLIITFPINAQNIGDPLPKWTPGTLDIHEIATGRGASTFFMLPDGTTMLFDAGEFTETNQVWRIPRYVDAKPDESRTSSEWITRYIERVLEHGPTKQIDYAMPSHFHWDHMGQVTDSSPKAKQGDYFLTGFTMIGEYVPIKTMLDRGWPDYDYLTDPNDRSLLNYRKFIDWQVKNNSMNAVRFIPGRNDQIVLKHQPEKYPGFTVQNIAANGEVWTGVSTNTKNNFPPLEDLNPSNYPNENISSLALRMSYGSFDYFTGGDIAGIALEGKPAFYDVETPIAQAVGPVEVSVLNHHGYIDSQNAFFVETLRPQVWIIPVWDSAHPSPMVYKRLLSEFLYTGKRDIFATSMHEANKLVVVGLDELASDNGHIVVRVSPGGKTFHVLVLDNSNEEMIIKSIHGPYSSR